MIQWLPDPGTEKGGTAPPHLILCGMPLARGGAPGWPGAPGLGAVTEQPGTDGIAPFFTVPTVCTSTPSQWPDAAEVLLDGGASFAVRRYPTALTWPGDVEPGCVVPTFCTFPGDGLVIGAGGDPAVASPAATRARSAS